MLTAGSVQSPPTARQGPQKRGMPAAGSAPAAPALADFLTDTDSEDLDDRLQVAPLPATAGSRRTGSHADSASRSFDRPPRAAVAVPRPRRADDSDRGARRRSPSTPPPPRKLARPAPRPRRASDHDNDGVTPPPRKAARRGPRTSPRSRRGSPPRSRSQSPWSQSPWSQSPRPSWSRSPAPRQRRRLSSQRNTPPRRGGWSPRRSHHGTSPPPRAQSRRRSPRASGGRRSARGGRGASHSDSGGRVRRHRGRSRSAPRWSYTPPPARRSDSPAQQPPQQHRCSASPRPRRPLTPPPPRRSFTPPPPRRDASRRVRPVASLAGQSASPPARRRAGPPERSGSSPLFSRSLTSSRSRSAARASRSPRRAAIPLSPRRGESSSLPQKPEGSGRSRSPARRSHHGHARTCGSLSPERPAKPRQQEVPVLRGRERQSAGRHSLSGRGATSQEGHGQRWHSRWATQDSQSPAYGAHDRHSRSPSGSLRPGRRANEHSPGRCSPCLLYTSPSPRD